MRIFLFLKCPAKTFEFGGMRVGLKTFFKKECHYNELFIMKMKSIIKLIIKQRNCCCGYKIKNEEATRNEKEFERVEES